MKHSLIKLLKQLLLFFGKSLLRKELEKIAQERLRIRVRKNSYYKKDSSTEELTNLLTSDSIFMARWKDVGWGIEEIEKQVTYARAFRS